MAQAKKCPKAKVYSFIFDKTMFDYFSNVYSPCPELAPEIPKTIAELSDQQRAIIKARFRKLMEEDQIHTQN